MRSFEVSIGLKRLIVPVFASILACGPFQNVQSESAPYFNATQAVRGRPLFAYRVGEQADAVGYEALAKQLRFKLESNAIHYTHVFTDDPLPQREEWAVPMGVVRNQMAVLTSRCLIDFKYPSRLGEEDSHFRNLAIFNGAQRSPRSVFMLSPVPGRPELTEVRDPRTEHMVFDNRLHLEDSRFGDRYFGLLATNRVERVQVDLVDGTWATSGGIDLAMLYFPLSDPAVASLRFPNANGPLASLNVSDPMAVVRAAMAGKTEYLQTFSFALITTNCLRTMTNDLHESEERARLWRGIAIAAAAAALAPLLGPMLAAEGGLAAFTAKVVTAAEHIAAVIGPKILAGAQPAAWRVVQRWIGGEQLSDVVWDESGRLVINAVIDGLPRQIPLAGVHRGTADSTVSKRVIATAKEFIRDRAGQLLIQSAPGHADVGTIVREDVGAELSSELLLSGVVALDMSDRATLARQPTLIKAASFALQNSEQAATRDANYQRALMQLAMTAQ